MLEPRWVEVIDEDGEHLGWTTEEQCQFLDQEVFEAEVPERFLKDPYLVYHADLAHAMGTLQGDLNSVQIVALQSHQLREAERHHEAREVDFERQMLLQPHLGAEAAEEWNKMRRQVTQSDERSFRWEAPPSAAELAEDMKALLEEEDVDWSEDVDAPYEPDVVEGMSE